MRRYASTHRLLTHIVEIVNINGKIDKKIAYFLIHSFICIIIYNITPITCWKKNKQTNKLIYRCSVSTTSRSWTIWGCRIICIIFASRRMFLATYLSWCARFLSMILTATYHRQERIKRHSVEKWLAWNLIGYQRFHVELKKFERPSKLRLKIGAHLV